MAGDTDRLRPAQSQQPDDRMAQVDGGHQGEEAQAALRRRLGTEFGRAKATVEQLQARVEELEEELEAKDAEIETLKARIREMS